MNKALLAILIAGLCVHGCGKEHPTPATGGIFNKRAAVYDVPPLETRETMSPDQEVFNEIEFFHLGLQENPGSWSLFEKQLRGYNLARCQKDTKELYNKMIALCEELERMELGMDARRTQAEKDKSNASASAGFMGGLKGAALIGEFDNCINDNSYNAYGENESLGLGWYILAGCIGGMVETYNQTSSIEAAAQQDLALLDSQRKRLVSDFQQEINVYKEGNTFRHFDVARTLAWLEGGGKGDWEHATKCRIPELNLRLALAASEGLDGMEQRDADKFWAAVVAEWPKTRTPNNELFGVVHGVLAGSAYATGDAKQSIALAQKGLEYHSGNGDLWEILGLASLDSGSPKTAQKSIQKAMECNPADGSYDISMARVLWRGFGNKNGALSSIRQAYGKGFCDIGQLRKCPDFEALCRDEEFVELTTVKVTWGHQEGLFFSDIWMKNESPFPITGAKLESSTAGWSWKLPSEDKTVNLAPGETYQEGWYSQPPTGSSPLARHSCEQDP